MGKELYDEYKSEFLKTINNIGNLPKKWQCRFNNGTDQRQWFDDLCKLPRFSDFKDEVAMVLSKFNIKLLSDEEKEELFLEYIRLQNKIPMVGEIYFKDNDDMHSWYIKYKQRHDSFETLVHNALNEYQDLDLATLWPDIKDEFIAVIKDLKRIPEHGEVIIGPGIDARVIYDKLDTYDPHFNEQLLLHLQTYNHKALSYDERKDELLTWIKEHGYIPFLRESRFSDKTDMFTWFTRYKKNHLELNNLVNQLITKEPQDRKVNIYCIPNFKKTGGKFYTICSNEGEKLDISNITTDEIDKLGLKKTGGLILKHDEEIGSVSFKGGHKK